MSIVLPVDIASVKPFDTFAVNDWTVARSCPLTTAERCVLRAIASHVDFDTGTGAWPSLKTIAAEAGVSRATVCRALNHFDELADLDCYPVRLVRERRYFNGQFTSNLYSIVTNNNSLVRPPSLMVRQQELPSLNADTDLRELSRNEEPECTAPFAATIAVIETPISEPSISSPIATPHEKNRPTKRPPCEQARRMLELAKVREQLQRDGRIVYPWQQRPVTSITKTRIVELDYPTQILDCNPNDIAAPIRCEAMPRMQADYAAEFLQRLRAAG